MARYQHAPDDAPLYRVPAALGGKVWPAYRVWHEGEGETQVALDVDGDLVRFFQDDLEVVGRPDALQDWAIGLVAHALAFEELHSGTCEGWACFAGPLAAVPAEVLKYVKAWSRP